jgi:hypothetical protein
MTRIGYSLIVVLLISVGLFFGVRTYIAHRKPYAPPRPANIPADAVYVQGPNGRGLWESCTVGASGIECMIANVSGSILHEGRFIPYRGDGPITQDQIVITQKSGDGWVSLANGAYLIPAEHNEASRRYLDFVVGDAKHF